MIRLLVLSSVLATALGAAVPAAVESYERHCAKCHGKDGKGQTRLGKRSGAPDFTDQARQAKLTDEDAFKGIKFGRRNAKGEERMDAFGGDLTDAEIAALVAYIRGFAKRS
jgi:mono/diheme cytochrome c family protein